MSKFRYLFFLFKNRYFVQGRPPILASPSRTDLVASFGFILFEMFLDRFIGHVLLIPWCALASWEADLESAAP